MSKRIATVSRPNASRPVGRSASSTQRSSSRNSRPTTSQCSTRPKSYINDAQCIALRESLVDEEKPDFEQIETSQLLSLLSHCREHTQKCALEENYKSAKKSRDLGKKVRDELTKRGTFHKSLQDLQNEVEAMRVKFEETWDKKKSDYNEETNKKLQELNEQQAHEMRRFERVWNEEMPHKYRKPSTQLLQLKQIEKSLAIAGKIDEADEIHSHAESLSEQEALKAQELLSDDYEFAKSRLLEHQNNEKRHFLDERERYRTILENKYQLAKKQLDNRNNVVSNRATKAANKNILMDSVSTKPTQLPKDTRKMSGTLLPPLVPPNDPRYIEMKKKRKEELAKIQKSYQKKNADQVLAQYS